MTSESRCKGAAAPFFVCGQDRRPPCRSQRGQMATVLERVRVRRLTMRPNARHGFQSPARTKAVRLNAWAGFSAAPAGAT